MEKAYFSNIAEKISFALTRAKTEVYVAMAWFTNERLLDILIECLRRDVKVNLLLLDSPINWMPYAPDFNTFIQAGGNMYIADSSIGFMHHKFCVIDESVIVTGSYNWTHYAESRNVENIIVSENIELSLSYINEFQRIKNMLCEAKHTPRLSWDEIETSIDFVVDEMNFELQEIARIRNIQNVLSLTPKSVKVATSNTKKTNTIISVIDTPKISKSKYEIGIESDDSQWVPFIKLGNELPNRQSIQMTLDNSNPEMCKCAICAKDGVSPYGAAIFELPLAEIARESHLNDEIVITIELAKNGYLHVEAVASKIGKTLDASLIDTDFVESL